MLSEVYWITYKECLTVLRYVKEFSMNLFKNVLFASIIFVGFAAANATVVDATQKLGEKITENVANNIGEEAGKKAAENIANNVANNPGFFSRVVYGVASGIKTCVWTAPTTFASNHPYWAAFIVAGVATAAVATYVYTTEEDADAEII